MHEDPESVLFHEQQRFREPFTWIILVSVSAVLVGTVAWMIVRQVVQDVPFGPEAMSDGALLSLGGAVVAINVFYVLRYAVSTLQTEVTGRGLFVRYWPRQQKVRRIDLTGVSDVKVAAYRPYLEYGGRGLKRLRRGTAYTVSGRRGVRLDYGNGAHVLIGTREPDRLAAAVRVVMGGASAPRSEEL